MVWFRFYYASVNENCYKTDIYTQLLIFFLAVYLALYQQSLDQNDDKDYYTKYCSHFHFFLFLQQVYLMSTLLLSSLCPVIVFVPLIAVGLLIWRLMRALTNKRENTPERGNSYEVEQHDTPRDNRPVANKEGRRSVLLNYSIHSIMWAFQLDLNIVIL